MQLLKYILRWQLSTPILFACTLLPLPPLVKTIIGNLLGALIFFKIDARIFNKEE